MIQMNSFPLVFHATEVNNNAYTVTLQGFS